LGVTTPRPTIPDVWAEKGCCPFCGTARLQVRHEAAAADQLVCAGCGAAFELELGGSRLHLTAAPAGRPLPQGAAGWLSAADARALLESVQPPPAFEPAPVAPPRAAAAPAPRPSSPLVAAVEAAIHPAPVAEPCRGDVTESAEILTRAEGLLALGNTPIQIQVALAQSGAAPEQVKAVMEVVRGSVQAKQERQIRIAWLLSCIVIVLAAAAAGVGFWTTRQTASATSAAPLASAPPPTPTGLVGFLMSQPTPVVQTEPPPATDAPQAGCPKLPAEAAGLFGGQAADWTFKPDVGGWIMTSVTARDVHVPAGMGAGYFGVDSAGAAITSVQGPANIQRVNFVAITCP
jgi:hypothetical protein